MKSGRTQVEIIALYEELGSYRAVGALMGCDHKTVKRYVEAAGDAGQLAPVLVRSRVTDDFAGLICERVEQTHGRVTARRLMRIVRAAGYEGSERSLRRAVADAKEAWRAKQALEGRVYRPWVSAPGEWMLCDWGAAGTVATPAGPRKLSFFSSVLGWSRFRTVSFSCSERFGALAVGLAHSFEQVGGVPGRVLFDNPKTVATGHLAGAAVLNPDLVRLAAHYRFSPRTTERQDPESKGKVEALVRFTKSDLIPYEGFGSLDEANQAGAAWCWEVNGEIHYETRARPSERLEVERPLFRSLPAARPAVACGEQRRVDRLATVRFVSARYSVPHRLVGAIVQVAASDRDVVIMHEGVPVAQHALLAPGEASIADSHYPTPAPTGVRALRPRTPSEQAFLALGPEAEGYLRAAAAAGTARLHERLDEALGLARTRGGDRTRAALDRATTFALAYIPIQIAGCISGAIVANAMFALSAVSIATTHRATPAHVFAEVIATFGLLLLIFALVRSGRAASAAAAVGAYIGAAYWFTSSTSFANPAISVGRMFSDTFAGIAPASVPAFVAAQLVGGALAYAVVRVLYPDVGPAIAADVVVPHDDTTYDGLRAAHPS